MLRMSPNSTMSQISPTMSQISPPKSQISQSMSQLSPETSQKSPLSQIKIPVNEGHYKSQLCCYICEPRKHFKISGKLRTHFSKLHDVNAQKRNIKCTKCGFVATKFEFMNDHIKQNHHLDYDNDEEMVENDTNNQQDIIHNR